MKQYYSGKMVAAHDLFISLLCAHSHIETRSARADNFAAQNRWQALADWWNWRFALINKRTWWNVGVWSPPSTGIATSYWRTSDAHAPDSRPVVLCKALINRLRLPQRKVEKVTPSTSWGTGFLLPLSYSSDDHTWIGTHVEYFLAMIH